MRIHGNGAALRFLLSALCIAVSTALSSQFVAVVGQRFKVGCAEIRPVGANVFWAVEAAAELNSGSFGIDWSADSTDGKVAVSAMMDNVAGMGANYLRVWAFSVVAHSPMQVTPGVYNETLFGGLDWVLAEASKRSLYVSLVLCDYWKYIGGVRQYVDWAGATTSVDFFSNPLCKEMYKQNALALIQRRNTITGVLYRDDPAIWGWELLNEPICSGCGQLLQSWVNEMAAFVAQADPNHIRTVGEEGFWQWFANRFTGFDANPEPWGGVPGQDFNANHASINISYTSSHLWPANWAAAGGLAVIFPEAFSGNWIQAHIRASAQLGKPLILSEFGHTRDTASLSHYNFVFSAIEESARQGQAGQGCAFWVMYPQWSTALTSVDSYAVYATDEDLMARFREHASAMKAIRGTTC